MDPRTLFIGRQIIRLDTVDSTNSFAQRLLHSEVARPAEGTVVTASEQLRGKGQQGNGWHSAAGQNILMSLILYPNFLAIRQQFMLSMAVSLGVRDAVRSVMPTLFDRTVSIKWPNDIYIGDRKLAGILIENTLRSHVWSAAVIGIGLNVHQNEFPNDLPNPTSMALEMPDAPALEGLLDKLFQEIEARYLQLKSLRVDRLIQEYESVLYRRGEWHTYEAQSICFQARLSGVSPDGSLLLETADGLRSFGFKEVSFR